MISKLPNEIMRNNGLCIGEIKNISDVDKLPVKLGGIFKLESYLNKYLKICRIFFAVAYENYEMKNFVIIVRLSDGAIDCREANTLNRVKVPSTIEFILKHTCGVNELDECGEYVINESKLRGIIKECIKGVLFESEPDEPYYPDAKPTNSQAEFYFNPNTLEICGEAPDAAYVLIYSADFPNAYCNQTRVGDYNNEPEYDAETGNCGGDFKVEEYRVPEAYKNVGEKMVNRFINQHRKEIVDTLTDNAEFD